MTKMRCVLNDKSEMAVNDKKRDEALNDEIEMALNGKSEMGP